MSIGVTFNSIFNLLFSQTAILLYIKKKDHFQYLVKDSITYLQLLFLELRQKPKVILSKNRFL